MMVGLRSQWISLLGLVIVTIANGQGDSLLGEYKQPTVSPPTDHVDPDLLSPVETEADMRNYLRKFGYDEAPAGVAELNDEQAEIETLKRFQRSAGIEPTGKFDAATRRMMRLPRCGVKDTGNGRMRRRKRYALEGSRWDGQRISYRFRRHTTDLPPTQTERIIQQAFEVWAKVTPLRFVKSTGSRADIDIDFARGEHGDGNPFDGPGRTLAHAFFPRFGGDTHFDEDETYTDGTSRGVNLLQVAAHEFGHALGLSHSDVPTALMAPFYRGYNPNFVLDDDDIQGIQAIYGRQTSGGNTPPPSRTTPAVGNTPTARPPSRTTTEPAVGACQGSFDAVASARNRFRQQLTYAFKGDIFYVIGRRNPPPTRIRAVFTNFPSGSVDAAIAIPDRRTAAIYVYLFKGSRLYRYEVTVSGSSHRVRYRSNGDISTSIRGLPSNVDAVFTWPYNNQIYVFKGRQYYRLAGTRVASTYPRSISAWNLPPEVTRVDAVVNYVNGRNYFFSGDKFYVFDDRNVRVSEPGRSIARYWLGCSSNIQQEEDSTEEEKEEETVMDTKVDEGLGQSRDQFENVPTVLKQGDVNGASSVNKQASQAALLVATVAMFFGTLLVR